MSIKIISDQTKPQKIKKYFKNIFHGNLIYIVTWVSPRTKADVGGLHTPLIGLGGRATSCRCSSVNDGSVNDGKQIAFVHTGRRQPMLTIPVSFVVIVMPSYTSFSTLPIFRIKSSIKFVGCYSLRLIFKFWTKIDVKKMILSKGRRE